MVNLGALVSISYHLSKINEFYSPFVTPIKKLNNQSMQAVGKPMLYKKQGHQGYQIKIVA